MRMFDDSFWRLIFRAKGVWNCTLSVVMLFLDAPLRAHVGMAPADPVYRPLFLALAFIFGIGYWHVGGDLRQREIVLLGVYGQVAVFVIVVFYFMQGVVHWVFLGPAVVDLVFAALFTTFLVRNRPAELPGS